MLYHQNQEPQLSEKLFAHPTSEYRATPFWAWNGELKADELTRQIEFFKEMGLGGFHMHVRSGMATPYLSDEFMHLIRTCVDKAKQEKMLAWLYDEDRWPSGAAGGLLTKDPQYRQRYLLFTADPYENGVSAKGRTGNGRLLACYDIELDENGCLKTARSIGEHEAAQGVKWYAYLETPATSPWCNNQTYANTLDKKTMDRFLEITHDRYAQAVGDEFGKTVPAIFTDEPQFMQKQTLSFAKEKCNVKLPWTDDLAETFAAAYGENLMEKLPELIWELPDGQISVARYHYHDHITERFTEAFSDNIGKWCADHGIALTGHVLAEPSLRTQTGTVGEAMRAYRSFELPGIDMLCSDKEYTTAKQAQSAVHQYGREGVMSELYGVTGWDFDFRGHKLNGDWQAALGVSVRVPHLSWYTMKGEAKRDYPASIHYQSTWGKEYARVEDHFARVNTAMTRGKPLVRVAVVHPIESYWLHWGPAEQTASIREQMDDNFLNLTKWLLLGTVDFDFLCESLLPQLCPKAGVPLTVGQMAYDVVIVPECETLRASTLERLEQFKAAGGRLIFLGKAPTLEDAVPSKRGRALFDQSEQLPFARAALLDALEPVRELDIRNANDGKRVDNLLHQFREDNGGRWLFIAHATNAYNPDIVKSQLLRITLNGAFRPTLYDTQTGEIKKIAYTAENGKTVIEQTLYDYDSLLFRLEPGEGALAVGHRCETEKSALTLPHTVAYTLDEPNVLLLDTAEVALDGGAFEPEEELLRAFGVCCRKLGLDWENAHTVQPWVYGKEKLTHMATLRFTVRCALPLKNTHFALENAELSAIRLNGQKVPMHMDGYFTDHAIQTVPMPELSAGVNCIEVDTPVGNTTGLEWCYLLGAFGVELNGREKTLTTLPETIGFDTVTMQRMPFYGADVLYHVPVHTNGGALTLTVPHYVGALVRVWLDGKDCGAVIYPPYRLELGEVPAGDHTLELKLFGSRQNCFGHVHCADVKMRWIGPGAWRTNQDNWTYEYRLRPMGLMSTPILEEHK